MVPKDKRKLPNDSKYLVNQLSVEDARHLIRTEGGPLTVGRAINRLGTTLVVSAFTARAIVVGNATAWHLFLPMLGEYLGLILALPVINLMLHDKALKKDARGSVRLLIAMVVFALAWTIYQSVKQGHSWGDQVGIEWHRMFVWITGHQMHWPFLGAMLGMILSLPDRVRVFHEHGPPFVPLGIGCGMRIVILLFGCFLVPWILGGPERITWALWAVLLFAEIGALVMHWDLQKRLAKRNISV